MSNNTLNKERLLADNKDLPIYQKVQNLILEEILSGTLKPGALIPSSRELAEQLGVSRKTTVRAIENLILKGYLESKDRVGTFVRKRSSAVTTSSQTTKNQNQTNQNPKTKNQKPTLVINDGFPDTMLVPFREFSRAHRQIFNRMAQWKMLGYNDAMGYERLRGMVADVLGRLAGLTVETDEISMVRGSQMALFLVANAVLSPGDHIAMEAPGYGNAYKAFQSARLNIHEIPVDDKGIDVDSLESLCQQTEIHAVYVTPRYQYPTTVTLSKTRRQKLRDLSIRYRFLVIEDDFGVAYNFSNRHIPTMSEMLPKSHYIYIGTFSKIFAPGIRLGYVASSRDIISQIASYRKLIDMQGDIITERAICELLDGGHLQKHLRHSIKIYKERLHEASAAIKKCLADNVNYKQPRGGLALWLTLNPSETLETSETYPPLTGELERSPTGKLEDSFRKFLNAHGIDAPVFTLANGKVGIRIGYASLPQQSLIQLLEKIQQFCNSQT